MLQNKEITTKKSTLNNLAIKENGVELENKIIGTINGRELNCEIIQAKDQGSKKRPVLLLFHGGAYLSGNAAHLRPQATYFALKYGFYTVNVEYSITPEKSLWPNPLLEATHAVRWVRSKADELNLDSENIVLCGGSAGGHLIANVAVNNDVKSLDGELEKYSSAPNCLVIYNGYYDLVKYPLDSQVSRMIGSVDQKAIKDASKEMSSFYKLDKNFPPILQMIGTDDPFYQQSVEFHEKLDTLGVHSEIEPYKDRGHAFFNKNEDFERTLKRMENFLVEQLKLKAQSKKVLDKSLETLKNQEDPRRK